jgi:hypothetical protein
MFGVSEEEVSRSVETVSRCFGESEKEVSRSVETVSRCLECLKRRPSDLWKRFPDVWSV